MNLKPAPVSSTSTVHDIVSSYKLDRLKKYFFIIGIAVLTVILIGVGLGIGAYEISFLEVYRCIWDRIAGGDLDTVDMRVVWDQRMPRMLTGIVVGAGLAAAGAAMQSMMKNPLADPYTTGISSGAAFGATIAIAFGFSIFGGQYSTVVSAFLFALVPVTVILFLSTVKNATPAMMILAGISVMYIFNAMTSYIMLIVDEQTMAAAYEWTIGTLSKASWSSLPIMAAFTAAGIVCLFILAKYLNALNSGDAFAKSLGINVNRIRITTLLIVSIVAAGIVSFTGIIGFIGMVAPHICRMFVGSDNKILIPSSMMLGVALVVFCDILAKVVSHIVVPIGIITAIFGGPLFLFLVIKQKREVW
jgi:iron complex transport system permease protein